MSEQEPARVADTKDQDVERFVAAFADALVRRDAAACAQLWGVGAGVVVADEFETAVTDRRDLEPFLAQAWPIYDFLGLARIEHRVLERADLTAAITRLTVCYSFFDDSGAHLTDGDFEYVLRRDADGLRCYVGINISAEPNLAGLARSRGYQSS